MKSKILAAFALAALACAIHAPAQAASLANQDFKVKATLTASCVINSTVANIDYGTVVAIASNHNAVNQTDLNVTCSNELPYTIALEYTGQMAGQTSGNTETLPYLLYQAEFNDGAMTSNVWDNGGNLGGSVVSSVGVEVPIDYTIYSKLAVTTLFPQLDSYEETVHLTIAD